jgi:FkbM family methyltransferase
MKFSEHALLLRYPYRSATPTLVDVGAHRGAFSQSFAEKGWRVVAFEPEQRNRAAFTQALASNANVTCLPLAVSDVAGQRVPFFTSSEHHGIHALRPFHPTHQPAYEVETTTLRETLPSLGVTRVTLLKIDIEGADFLALRGCDLAVCQPELAMLEFMDERSVANFGYTHHDVVAFMQAAGYAAFVSAWAPITSYAREGDVADPHTWIECSPYPLSYEPAWGNLIFVPQADRERFAQTLAAYIRDRRLRDTLAAIPGARGLYDLLRRVANR